METLPQNVALWIQIYFIDYIPVLSFSWQLVLMMPIDSQIYKTPYHRHCIR